MREAHALDGVLPERHNGRWLGFAPERNLYVEDALTYEERGELALRCELEMELGRPFLVDEMDDAVNEAYAAWPERLYLVDLDGTIAYKGARGPEGFLVDELDATLERCKESWARGEPAGSTARPRRERGGMRTIGRVRR